MPNIRFRALVPVLALALASFVTMRAGDAAPAADYRIKPGDTVAVTVFGEDKLSQPTLRVLPNGSISMPMAGDVPVAGYTPAQASDNVARALLRYFRYPRVTVSVVTVGSIDVLVLGNVKTPGKYSLQSDAHLTDALAVAGGMGPNDGAYPMARITRADGMVANVSLQGLLHDGNAQLNVPLENETTVYVTTPMTLMVEVFGAVDHPGDITLKEGDRLITAVARAGASTGANPDLNRVTVRRMMANGQSVQQTFDLYAIMNSGNLSRDLVLQKGDVIYVPQAKKKLDFNPLSILSRWIPL